MRIIPVIDVKSGIVVRAIAGRRHEYQPIQSQITDSTDPLKVAEDLLRVTSAGELYVADLDAIQSDGQLSEPTRRFVRQLPGTVWLDVGFRDPHAVLDWPVMPNVRPILALESYCPNPQPDRSETDARQLTAAMNQMAFSLDLRNGEPRFCHISMWEHAPRRDPVFVAEQFYSRGFRTIIVIDVSRVGTGIGSGTEALCTEIKRQLPQVELIAGGGVRDWDDIHRLEDAGADAVLVASSLHDGRLIGRS